MDSPSTTRASLADLIGDPAALDDVPREAIPALRGLLAQLDTLLLGRLLSGPQSAQGTPEDQLLDVAEAAGRLGVSPDYLYRHHKSFSFTRRVGRKLLFSAQGIAKHIRNR